MSAGTELEMTPEDVARLSRTARKERVRALVDYAYEQLDAIQDGVVLSGRKVAATAVLYSGGNDSTVLAHLFRNRADLAVHVNTGIGIERTRTFVRDTCKSWNLPLLEEHPPKGSTYEELVMDQGFPGPGHHWKMYQRLKERGLRKARKTLLHDAGVSGHKGRVIFLAGRRRTESERRANIPESQVEGSVIWLSPIALWTKMDLNTYRLMNGDVPTNEVTSLLHMSGECLCGAFAHKNELDEIGLWFPAVRAEIEALEAKVLCAGKVPAWKARWGWGADGATIAKMKRAGMSDDEIASEFVSSVSGMLCSSCDAKQSGGEVLRLDTTETGL